MKVKKRAAPGDVIPDTAKEMCIERRDANIANPASANPNSINPINLNERWRVASDNLQWKLEYRRKKGGGSAKSDKHAAWQGKRFCRTRRALIRDIGELCGEVDPAAAAIVQALPGDINVD